MLQEILFYNFIKKKIFNWHFIKHFKNIHLIHIAVLKIKIKNKIYYPPFYSSDHLLFPGTPPEREAMAGLHYSVYTLPICSIHLHPESHLSPSYIPQFYYSILQVVSLPPSILYLISSIHLTYFWSRSFNMCLLKMHTKA